VRPSALQRLSRHCCRRLSGAYSIGRSGLDDHSCHEPT
jgi:hypothetical protein